MDTRAHTCTHVPSVLPFFFFTKHSMSLTLQRASLLSTQQLSSGASGSSARPAACSPRYTVLPVR